MYEGGEEENMTEVVEEPGHEDETYGEQQDFEDDIDPDDPYQINRLNEMSHEYLKELYAQVVDELLDIQLEFEEKLAEAEDQAKGDLEAQKEMLEDSHKKQVDELTFDLDKHKQAIEKLLKKNEVLLRQ